MGQSEAAVQGNNGNARFEAESDFTVLCVCVWLK